MNNEKEVKSLIEKIEAGFESVFKKFAPKAESKAISLSGADGKMYNVQSEDDNLVGKPVTVDGQPANGNVALSDGRTLVCEAGIVKEVKEAMTPEQKELNDLRAKVQALETEKAAALAAQTQAQTQVAEVTTAMETLKGEVVALKKLTVGDPNPPGKGKTQDPTGTTKRDPQMEAFQREILTKAGLLN